MLRTFYHEESLKIVWNKKNCLISSYSCFHCIHIGAHILFAGLKKKSYSMLHSTCVTCRLGLHVSGKFAADTVVIGANVMKTPSSELLSTMELRTKSLFI